jgi:hypothetical protein
MVRIGHLMSKMRKGLTFTGSALLLENGSFLLQENGSFIILE